jgi:hypothetical protein
VLFRSGAAVDRLPRTRLEPAQAIHIQTDRRWRRDLPLPGRISGAGGVPRRLTFLRQGGHRHDSH